jgi:sulfhydrogenase subunit delta
MNLRVIKVTDKPKVGFYGITGCAGCLLSVVFNRVLTEVMNDLDIKAFPFIKEKDTKEQLDIIFLEGVVANNHDIETLQRLRQQGKILIALGACATLGGAPALRNFQDKKQFEGLNYEKEKDVTDVDPKPIDKFVKVDYYIHGCPPDKEEIRKVINDLLLGKKPMNYSKPVCIECRRNKNPCLLQLGKPCLGPITKGNCNAICLNGGLVCWGCRGPVPDADFNLMIQVLKEKGYTDAFIRNRINTFEGWKLKESEDKDAKND